MDQLLELIRGHRLGSSRRLLARRLRMGRDTIRQYLSALDSAGLLEGPADALPDVAAIAAVVAGLSPETPVPEPVSSVAIWRPRIVALRAGGAGPTAIHDHLRLVEPDYAGTLSAVKRICARLTRQAGPSEDDVAIPVETAPGEVAQVDFGYVGKIYDPERGLLRKAWVFVLTLGFSRHGFCALAFDQKASTWVDLHVAAFAFLGGVPRVLVPDNLKAAVVRAAFAVDDEPVLHRSYRELARHFGFQIDPAPPRAPQKKGKVEAGVRYVKHSFFATHESVDIHEDQRMLSRWVLEIAGTRRHGTTGRAPLELFEEQERKALLPLPATRWERVLWKQALLHRDSHIQVDGAFYSAPWKLLGERLWVRCSEGSIAIHHCEQRVATHRRVARGQRSTIEAHLPEHRSPWRHRSREHWLARASALGEEVLRLATAIFDSDDVLLQLRKVQAVVSHLEGFPKERAAAACRRALAYGCLEYRGLKDILRKGLDLAAAPPSPSRAWSSGSRFARTPSPSLPLTQEPIHGPHR